MPNLIKIPSGGYPIEFGHLVMDTPKKLTKVMYW